MKLLYLRRVRDSMGHAVSCMSMKYDYEECSSAHNTYYYPGNFANKEEKREKVTPASRMAIICLTKWPKLV